MVDRARAAAALGNLSALLSPGGQSAASYAAIRASFLISLSSAAADYLDGGDLRQTKNGALRAMVESYGQVADAASGGPLEPDALSFFNDEVQQERDAIESFWGELKMSRTAGDTTLPTSRLEMYGRSLDNLYANLSARAARNAMLELVGDDGLESCRECQKYKGQIHRARWWMDKGLIPGPGNENYTCKGFNCQHKLRNVATGEIFTA